MVVAAFDSREIGNKGLSVKATEGQPGLLSSQCTSNRGMNQNYCPFLISGLLKESIEMDGTIIIVLSLLSWNSLGEQKKTLVTFHVYFWHLINGFEVLKTPAFSFTRRNRTTLPKSQLSSARHDLNKKLSKLAKIIEIFWLTLSCFPSYVVGTAETLASFVK